MIKKLLMLIASNLGGLQLISSNPIKSGNNYILPSLKLLFNKILISGMYPRNFDYD